MIDVKQAVKSAFDFANGLQDVMNAANFTLEEVQLSDDGNVWLVTLGYFDSASALERFVSGSKEQQRRYKIFRINAENGEVLAMVFPTDVS